MGEILNKIYDDKYKKHLENTKSCQICGLRIPKDPRYDVCQGCSDEIVRFKKIRDYLSHKGERTSV